MSPLGEGGRGPRESSLQKAAVGPPATPLRHHRVPIYMKLGPIATHRRREVARSPTQKGSCLLGRVPLVLHLLRYQHRLPPAPSALLGVLPSCLRPHQHPFLIDSGFVPSV